MERRPQVSVCLICMNLQRLQSSVTTIVAFCLARYQRWLIRSPWREHHLPASSKFHFPERLQPSPLPSFRYNRAVRSYTFLPWLWDRGSKWKFSVRCWNLHLMFLETTVTCDVAVACRGPAATCTVEDGQMAHCWTHHARLCWQLNTSKINCCIIVIGPEKYDMCSFVFSWG